MFKATLAISACCSMFALGGCVGIPTAVPEPTPFKELLETRFVVGETTANDIRDELGTPTIEEPSRLIYQKSRDGWNFYMCAWIIINANCGSLGRTSKDFFLVAELGTANVLTQAVIVNRKNLCEEHNVCIKESLLMLAANQPEDIHFKQFLPPASGCIAYVYADTSDDSLAAEIKVDGQLAGPLVGPRGYHAIAVEEGLRLIYIESARGDLAALAYECRGPSISFLRYDQQFFSSSIHDDGPVEGQEQVRQRWLAQPVKELLSIDQTNWLHGTRVFVQRDGLTVTAIRPGDGEDSSSFGTSFRGEICGMVAALTDYGLSPAGGRRQLLLAAVPAPPTQFAAVCNETDECTFDSVFGQSWCKVAATEYIRFERWQPLLVIEPNGASYKELFYGKGSELDDFADCRHGECKIEVRRLRDLQP